MSETIERNVVLNGDALEILRTMPENSVDAVVTDPSYFLINKSGSGFMGKEWDGITNLWKYLWSDDMFAGFAVRFLSQCRVGQNTGEESIAQMTVNRTPLKQCTSKNVTCVAKNSITQTRIDAFAQVFVLTRQDLLDLLNELSPSPFGEVVSFLSGVSENVLFAIPITLPQNELKSFVQRNVTLLNKVAESQEFEIIFTKTETQRIRGVIEETTGELSGNRYMNEMNGDAENAGSTVIAKRFSVTTLSPFEKLEIMERITLLLCAYHAMRLSSSIPNILIGSFLRSIFREVLRVMKPGAHLLAFGGTRTYHRMVVNIEDAGFEIRDQIQWLHGSGFPKSLDVSKAIDKEAGAERQITGVQRLWGANASGGRGSQNGNDYQETNPGAEKVVLITEPATDEAKRWDGWGTALKPANEPICLARKPISESTVAKNVLRWRTGALNIDGCRVDSPGGNGVWGSSNESCQDGRTFNASPNGAAYRSEKHPLGRWPANVMLDEEAARMLDEQTGTLTSGLMKAGQQRSQDGGYHGGFPENATGHDTPGDSGGASRFFYVAKASKSERNAGLEMVSTRVTSKEFRPNDDGTRGLQSRLHGATVKGSNHHPTVKPISLMRNLVKLITPAGGVVLDPFGGTATTGIGCKLEGFDYIVIEKEKEYCEIGERRLKHWTRQEELI